MANQQVQKAGGPAQDSGPKRAWYSGYLNASATAMTSAPYIGCAMFVDLNPNAAAPLPPGTSSSTQSFGMIVTQAATANLGLFAGIVKGGERQVFSLDANGASQPGWVELAGAGEAVVCSTHANMTLGATFLSGTNAQWYLGTTNSLTALPSTVVPTISLLGFTVGLALETKDTSTTTGDATCRIFGGLVGTRI